MAVRALLPCFDHDIPLCFSFTGNGTDDWHYAVKRLQARGIAPTELITHRLPLEKLWEGLDVMRDRKGDRCKVMILQEF